MDALAIRGPLEKFGGLVHFDLMLDELRLHARGRLPADYEIQTILDIIDGREPPCSCRAPLST
jgi:hypothetical protein